MLAVGCLAMLAVPLALPSGSSTVHAATTTPRAQLVADRVASHAGAVRHTLTSGASAHLRTPSASVHAPRTALTHAQWLAAVRYQSWRRSLAYQSWRRATKFAAWQSALHYQSWRRAVATASAARVAASRRHSATVSAVAPPRTVHGERVGVATWYAWRPGQCASSYRPRGSRIWITDIATGKTVSCLVTDVQPYSANRVVDMNEASFAQLAPLWRGVVRVRVTW